MFSFAVNNFNQEAGKVQFDLTGDSEETMKVSKQIKKWDRKKKKMVTVDLVNCNCLIDLGIAIIFLFLGIQTWKN